MSSKFLNYHILVEIFFDLKKITIPDKVNIYTTRMATADILDVCRVEIVMLTTPVMRFASRKYKRELNATASIIQTLNWGG